MFSQSVRLPDLVDLCRVLRHQLGAGLSIHQVFKKQSERGRPALRAITGRISDALQQGTSLGRALDAEGGAFPPLFLSMVKVGETTGHIAEIFGELERYFQLELQLRRQFRARVFFPIAQFVFAVAVVAGLIYILGILAQPGTKPLLTIFGLSGAAGSLAFLSVVIGSLLAVAGIWFIISRLGRQKAWMDRLLLTVPVLGPCLTALVMSRLTLALQLTLDSGLSITRALPLSLEATGNAYYAAASDGIARALKNGQALHEALEASGLFSSDFLEMVISSEASGSVPEMMRHLAGQYQEEAGRKMKLLTGAAGGVVWAGVAAFIIWAIFRLANVYLDALGGGKF